MLPIPVDPQKLQPSKFRDEFNALLIELFKKNPSLKVPLFKELITREELVEPVIIQLPPGASIFNL